MPLGIEWPAYVTIESDVYAPAFSRGDVIVAGGSTRYTLNGPLVATPYTQHFRWASKTWALLASLPEERQYHTLTVAGDGRIIAAGGQDSNGVYRYLTPTFSQATQTWSQPFTTALAQGRVSHRAVRLQDGRVMVVGGHAPWRAAQEIFNPATNLWSFDTTRLLTPRINHVAVALTDGRVLVAGGWNGTALSSAELITPFPIGNTPPTVEPTATPGAPQPASLSEAVDWPAAVRAPDGRVVIAGGGNGAVTAKVDVFRPDTNAWMPNVPPMPSPRSSAGMTLIGANGRVFLGGGWYAGQLPTSVFAWSYHLWRDGTGGAAWAEYTDVQTGAGDYFGHNIPIVSPGLGYTAVLAGGTMWQGASGSSNYGAVYSFCDEECNDGNLCTIDTCAPNGACVNTPKACADTNVCDGVETCNPATGACVDGTALPIGTPAPDDLPCNGIETCDGLGNTVWPSPQKLDTCGYATCLSLVTRDSTSFGVA